ncbi:hypothetical protein GQX74_005782 [Glossina fuscipes]|nr:hypothetical protein GQX74_005782 [Glossina fuscipes]
MASASKYLQANTNAKRNCGCSGTSTRLYHTVAIHPTDVDLTELNYDPNNQVRFALVAGLEITNIPSRNHPPKSPLGEKKLNEKTKNQNYFCAEFIHGLKWCDGFHIVQNNIIFLRGIYLWIVQGFSKDPFPRKFAKVKRLEQLTSLDFAFHCSPVIMILQTRNLCYGSRLCELLEGIIASTVLY